MQIISLYLITMMLATLWFDLTRYKIPNWISGSLLLLYPAAVYLAPGAIDWKMALVGMLMVFAVGYMVFSMRWMAGGDIKLITALSLWVGFAHLLEFIFAFALFGGAFSLFVLVVRKMQPYLPWKQRFKTPRLFQNNAPIPYGVAIAGGFLWLMAMGSVEVLAIGN